MRGRGLVLSALLCVPLLAETAEARAPHGRGAAAHGANHGKHVKHDRHAAPKHGKAHKRGKGRRRGGKRRETPPQMPTRIELTAMDLTTGTAHVDVIGTTRTPATRLFILTDHSGRRFVPSFAECYPPPGVHLPGPAPNAAGEEDGDDDPMPSGPELPASTHWRCTLTIPRLYRRAPLAGMGMEWGDRYVAAPTETVQRLWGEARAAAPLSAIADRQTIPALELPPVRKNPLSMPEHEDPPLDDDPSDTSITSDGTKSEREPPPTE